MAAKSEHSGHPGKGRRIAALACNIAGIGILVLTILILLPAVLPQAFGFRSYEIVSASMEPAIPVGSMVFTQDVDPATVADGDVIAFSREDSVVVHRVRVNQKFEGQFVTQGDANADVDMQATAYANYLGKVVLTVPMLGGIEGALTTTVGKVYLLLFAICGVLFNVLASRLRA